MNSKNPRARYWVVGLVVFLVGIGVAFRFPHFSPEPVISGGLAREEWPQVQAAVRRAKIKKVMRAVRTWEWRELPALLADCLGGPVTQVTLCVNDNDHIVTHAKSSTNGFCYFLMKTKTNWMVTGETLPARELPSDTYSAHPVRGK
jgi:hypothetical protein